MFVTAFYGCPWWGEEQSGLAGLTELLSGRRGGDGKGLFPQERTTPLMD